MEADGPIQQDQQEHDWGDGDDDDVNVGGEKRSAIDAAFDVAGGPTVKRTRRFHLSDEERKDLREYRDMLKENGDIFLDNVAEAIGHGIGNSNCFKFAQMIQNARGMTLPVIFEVGRLKRLVRLYSQGRSSTDISEMRQWAMSAGIDLSTTTDDVAQLTQLLKTYTHAFVSYRALEYRGRELLDAYRRLMKVVDDTRSRMEETKKAPVFRMLEYARHLLNTIAKDGYIGNALKTLKRIKDASEKGKLPRDESPEGPFLMFRLEKAKKADQPELSIADYYANVVNFLERLVTKPLQQNREGGIRDMWNASLLDLSRAKILVGDREKSSDFIGNQFSQIILGGKESQASDISEKQPEKSYGAQITSTFTSLLGGAGKPTTGGLKEKYTENGGPTIRQLQKTLQYIAQFHTATPGLIIGLQIEMIAKMREYHQVGALARDELPDAPIYAVFTEPPDLTELNKHEQDKTRMMRLKAFASRAMNGAAVALRDLTSLRVNMHGYNDTLDKMNDAYSPTRWIASGDDQLNPYVGYSSRFLSTIREDHPDPVTIAAFRNRYQPAYRKLEKKLDLNEAVGHSNTIDFQLNELALSMAPLLHSTEKTAIAQEYKHSAMNLAGLLHEGMEPYVHMLALGATVFDEFHARLEMYEHYATQLDELSNGGDNNEGELLDSLPGEMRQGQLGAPPLHNIPRGLRIEHNELYTALRDLNSELMAVQKAKEMLDKEKDEIRVAIEDKILNLNIHNDDGFPLRMREDVNSINLAQNLHNGCVFAINCLKQELHFDNERFLDDVNSVIASDNDEAKHAFAKLVAAILNSNYQLGPISQYKQVSQMSENKKNAYYAAQQLASALYRDGH